VYGVFVFAWFMSFLLVVDFLSVVLLLYVVSICLFVFLSLLDKPRA
jgi:hypothetical protein